ncbi:MAG: NAD+ synthase [Actinomycetota bacterium]
MRRLRVAAAQINPRVGDLDGNAERIVRAYREAVDAGADLVAFPELAITGYPPEDLLLKPGFVDAAHRAVGEVAERTGDAVAVIGFPEGGAALHNAAAICSGGLMRSVYRKRLLPNYAVFDEARYFVPGTESGPLLDVAGVRVGVSICEDVWSSHGPLIDQAVGGAEVAININGSPYQQGKWDVRERMLSTRAADAGIPLVYCNCVGGQDELVFDGHSTAFDAEGRLLARAAMFDEELLVVDLEIRGAYRQRILDPRGRPDGDPLPVVHLTPAPSIDAHARPAVATRITEPPDELAEVYDALVVGTRDYVRKNGFSEVVIGMSGGIDSSLTAVVAVDALGPEHVHGVGMPSRYSSEGSVSDAEKLAGNLGIDFRTIAIEPAHAALLEMLAPSFGGLPPDVTEENLQSRIRGVTWMALSNKFGWLVLTCGNKSEAAVGYATLYGDTAGGYAVIKDVYKTLVYDLCRWRNVREGSELVPESVITKPPSAELRPDQRDDQSLPPYDILDPILHAYIDEDMTVDEIVLLGFEADVVARIARLVDLAEYKRRQSPPGPRITGKAFGRDRRLPITNGFR